VEFESRSRNRDHGHRKKRRFYSLGHAADTCTSDGTCLFF